MKYLREFVIGSSYFVVVLFYHAVYISIQKKKEFSEFKIKII